MSPEQAEEMRTAHAAEYEAGVEALACDDCGESSPATLEACPWCADPVEAPEPESSEQVSAQPEPSEQKSKRAQLAKARAARAESLGINVGKIKIDVGADIDRVVALSVQALETDESLYQRDGQLCTVLRATPEDQKTRRAAVAVGSPIIRLITTATLKERLAARIIYTKLDAEGKRHEVAPPGDVVSAVHDRGQWSTVRPIVGLIEAPSIRPDGTIIDAPGYDPATGYVLIPSADFPAVPLEPTQKDAVAALAAIDEVYADFPYQAETDEMRAAMRAVPVALTLTMIARPAIDGPTPAVVLDAVAPGLGKTLASKAATTIAQGRPAPLATWPPTEEELEKILASHALSGGQVIIFDNLATPLKGAPLDKCLTADAVMLRVLGRSETPVLPWRSAVVATGNNVEIHGDTCRRVILCRLDAAVENPEEREGFAHTDLVAWCKTERPRLVVAALTLLRAYCVAGRPPQALKPFGSFESWAALVPSAIVWAGGGDCTLTRQEVAAKADPKKVAFGALLANWSTIDDGSGGGISAKELLAAAYTKPDCTDVGRCIDDPMAPIRESLEALCPSRAPDAKPTAHQLGTVLRRHRDRVVAGRALRAETDRNGVARWRVSETSPATPRNGVEVRGVRGVAGGLGLPSMRETEQSECMNGWANGGEHPPRPPSPPADAPLRPRSSVGRSLS